MECYIFTVSSYLSLLIKLAFEILALKSFCLTLSSKKNGANLQLLTLPIHSPNVLFAFIEITSMSSLSAVQR